MDGCCGARSPADWRSGWSQAVSAGGPHYVERNLPFQAATAVAYGLPHDEALRAITIYPARILGVADRVGSLETGKDATLIVTTGDVVEITSQVESAFLQGRAGFFVRLLNSDTRSHGEIIGGCSSDRSATT